VKEFLNISAPNIALCPLNHIVSIGVTYKTALHWMIRFIAPYTRESKKLSALLFFQFIYTKVGVEQVRHFPT
jgi:hypothetical protein